MAEAWQHVGLFLLSWLFWLPVMYLFTHFFFKKQGTVMTTRQKIATVGKGALFCATAAAAIRLILWVMHQLV
ncbi:hypothetical protein [Sporomusa sphaeroides]|uniref:hypothetical protein n=1 Tax=Sporomusa sphaeroides TaxID=47679 RepID=UPI002C5F5BB0|nr:hypothetical protein [Sporomusa sphaeroides]HML35211.1 hypothetical protein [Sporomusa sphaeroides]